ncbi:hypothetical protein HKX48_005512 [Thoreauomyces humboldtii]|nr:hypothetical protein HKX48_005512 [Thoreauomyces humboldtii]
MSSTQRQLDHDGKDTRAGSLSLLDTVGRSAFSNSRASFMIQSLTLSATSACVAGIASAIVLGGPLGGALSFTAGSSLGFLIGAVGHYTISLRTALDAVIEFPDLMRAHIRWNYPETDCALRTDVGWRTWRTEAFGERPRLCFGSWRHALFTGDPRKRAMAMSSYYSAAGSIDVIKRRQEDVMVEKYAVKPAGRGGREQDEFEADKTLGLDGKEDEEREGRWMGDESLRED